MDADQIVKAALDAAGAAGGIDEIRRIAAKGPGDMYFSEEDMAILVEAYGTPGDAIYEIQLAAQNIVSSIACDEVQVVSALPREWLDTAEQREAVAQWARDYDWGAEVIEDPQHAADQVTGELAASDSDLPSGMLERLNAELVDSARMAFEVQS